MTIDQDIQTEKPETKDAGEQTNINSDTQTEGLSKPQTREVAVQTDNSNPETRIRATEIREKIKEASTSIIINDITRDSWPSECFQKVTEKTGNPLKEGTDGDRVIILTSSEIKEKRGMCKLVNDRFPDLPLGNLDKERGKDSVICLGQTLRIINKGDESKGKEQRTYIAQTKDHSEDSDNTLEIIETMLEIREMAQSQGCTHLECATPEKHEASKLRQIMECVLSTTNITATVYRPKWQALKEQRQKQTPKQQQEKDERNWVRPRPRARADVGVIWIRKEGRSCRL